MSITRSKKSASTLKRAAVLTVLSLSAILTTSGCKLLPGRVEYFNKEVQAIPEIGSKAIERQKQAAALVAEKTEQTKEAAIAEEASPAILVPAAEASILAGALSTSLGPPLKPSSQTATNLAAAVKKDRAEVDAKIGKARDKQQEFVGKKIEGTGLFQIGYFTQLAFVAGGLFLAWTALKIYGVMNPAVGAGLGVVKRVSSGLVAKSLNGTAQGIEAFKKALGDQPSYTPAEVKERLATALQMKQDSEVQRLLRELTTK